MANITLTIPDDKLNDVVSAYCKAYGYQETIDGQPNPQTKAQFTKARVIDEVKRVYLQYKRGILYTSADTDVSVLVNNLNIT